MNVFTALYRTYENALENGYVDRTEAINNETVLLPIYHSSKKSTGKDILQVSLDRESNFIKAEWLEKDKVIIFPVTERSMLRSGTTSAPHSICDEFSYLSETFDSNKYMDYMEGLREWVEYSEVVEKNEELEIICNYMEKKSLFQDCLVSLFKNDTYQVENNNEVTWIEDNKVNKIDFTKIMVTFKIESEVLYKEDFTISTSKELHTNYIMYVNYKNNRMQKEVCDISGQEMYCIPRHRGLLGNAKIISISNHNETYYGRFKEGSQIIRIGYEVSQKIHLMLKYLLENKNTKKQIGESSYLVNWFSNDIGNESGINLLENINEYTSSSNESLTRNDEFEDEIEFVDESIELVDSYNSVINQYITGEYKDIDVTAQYYILIIDKIVNGRISVKYFDTMSTGMLLERVKQWYVTTNWKFYHSINKSSQYLTPSIYKLTDAIYGRENEKAYLECRNKKLRTKTIERLLPCVLGQARVPMDLKNQIFYKLCNRRAYDKTWNTALSTGCVIIKKYQLDHKLKSEVNDMLNNEEQNRSYLYGRLLAIYEKIELDAYNIKNSSHNERRETNVERYWSAYTKNPEKVLNILTDKLQPYKTILNKSRPNLAQYYQNMIAELLVRLREEGYYETNRYRALSEEFLFGYYAQRQAFYMKKTENDEINETVIKVEKGE